MSFANPYEQYILESINIERAKVGAQPLAFNINLNDAAEDHSTWMDTTDTLTHTGAGGSSPYDRMIDAGYVFSSTFWAYGENIAAFTTNSTGAFLDEIDDIHSFFMGSPAHKTNILNDTFREIGVGFTIGQYHGYESVFITQDFAATASNPFLTGVAFEDLDGDKRYDINEGLSNLTVSIQNNNTGAIITTQTGPAGGYELELTSGSYTVNFTNGAYMSETQQINIGSKNVKLDLIDPTISTSTPESEPEPEPTPTEPQPTQNIIYGTADSDTLIGTSNDDEIYGFSGRDKLYGSAGNDLINGGDGHDKLYGNAGTDILIGGKGKDAFLFDTPFNISGVDKIVDFSTKDDVIKLDNMVFTSLSTGKLKTTAFHSGVAAHDSTDRIIYDAQTGDLYYDADGSGSTVAQQFAELTAGLSLTPADFYIF